MNYRRKYIYFLLTVTILASTGCSTMAPTVEQLYETANTQDVSLAERHGNQVKAEMGYVLSLKHARYRANAREVSDKLLILGQYYARQNRYGDSVESILNSLEIEEKLSGPTHPRTIKRVIMLAGTYYALGDFPQVWPLVQRARITIPELDDETRMLGLQLVEELEETKKLHAKIYKEICHSDPSQPDIMFKLGCLYQEGLVVERNNAKALRLFHEAVHAGYKDTENFRCKLR